MEGINFNPVLLLTKKVPALGTVQSVCAALLLLPCVCLGFWGVPCQFVLQKCSWGCGQVHADSWTRLGYQGLHAPADAKELVFSCLYQARSHGPWLLGFGRMMLLLLVGLLSEPRGSWGEGRTECQLSCLSAALCRT